MKTLNAAILAVLVAPALAFAQHEHHGGAPAREVKEAPAPKESAPASGNSAPSGGGGEVAAGAPEGDGKGGLRIGLDLDHSLGHGTFVDTRYYSSFGGSLGFGPSYGFKLKEVKLSASARASINWEYTSPDGTINGRRVNYSDIRLGLSAPGIYKEKLTGIGASLNFGLSVPITRESIFASTITNLSLGASLSRSFFEKLNVGFRVGVGKGIQGSTQVLVSRPATEQRDELGNLLTICRTDDEYCGTMGNNTAFSLSTGLSAGYSLNDKLSFSISYGLSTSWKYALTDTLDEYSSKALDEFGNPVVRVGLVRPGDRSTASLGASYSLTDNLGLSFSMATAGPVRTKDGKNFRFPFFDFIGPADSLTNYSLAASASF